MIETERLTALNGASARPGAGYVLYWMQAAQRADCNHALWYAAREADRLVMPLVVLFVIADYPAATARHYRWMLAGLRQTASSLRDAGMCFCLSRGDPPAIVAAASAGAALVVVDRSPARWSVAAKSGLAGRLGIPVIEVDGESIIPEAVASPKQEWSARTFRLKIDGAVGSYAGRTLPPVPVPRRRCAGMEIAGCGQPRDAEQEELFSLFDAPQPALYPGDRCAEQVFPQISGPVAARIALARFIDQKLDRYDEDRNDPTLDGGSGLSPYLHFGQLSPLSVIAAARTHGGTGYPAFAEQLVVRRELCRNFARYRPLDYDTWEGLPSWSRAALEASAADKRAFVYTRAQFEASATHDPYWNAAQEQLVRTGVIHNYMRMYWGKMLLAWSASPREALVTAMYLNDRYALDGRDPNGWAGVAWCFGLHDRPWPSRPVFGTVRAMAASGLKRKFDADAYARSWAPRGHA